MTHVLSRLLSVPMLVLAGLGIGYGLYARHQGLTTLPGGQAQQVLSNSTNAQFVAFVAVTFWLVASLRVLPDIGNAADLIRHGSNLAALIRAGVDSLGTVVLAATLLVICWTATTLGVPAPAGPIFVVVSVIAVIGQVALVAVTFSVLRMSLLVIRLRLDRRWIEYLAAAAFWLWSSLSAAGLIDDRSPLNAGRFLNVSLAFGTSSGALPTAILLVLAIAGVLTVGWLLDSRVEFGVLVRTGWAPFVVLIAFVTLNAAANADSAVGTLIAIFAGRSGTLLSFLTTTLVVLGFSWFTAQRLSTMQTGGTEQELLRFGSGRRWAWNQLSADGLRALTYLAAIVVGSALVATIDGAPLGGSAVGATTYEVLVNGTLQLLFYAGVILAALWLVPGQFVPLLALAAFLVLNYVLAPGPAVSAFGHPHLPAGGWPSLLATTALLLGCVAATFGAIAVAARIKPVGLKES